MRPDKPGYWWYKTSDGTEKIADTAYGYSYELCVVKNQRHVRVSVFECSSDFGKWLGPACPPKKVDRYSVGMLPMDLQIKPHERGPLVLYDDVKEFLLKGDENG